MGEEKNYLSAPCGGATDKTSAYKEASRRYGIGSRAKRDGYETTHAGISYQGSGGTMHHVDWCDLPAAK